jgi:hypothetical protein
MWKVWRSVDPHRIIHPMPGSHVVELYRNYRITGWLQKEKANQEIDNRSSLGGTVPMFVQWK